jgi:hypothetical protein
VATYLEPEPIPGPDAFHERNRSGALSQSAFLLATGAAIGGYADTVPHSEQFPLPDLAAMRRTRKMTRRQALTRLDVAAGDLDEHPEMRIAAADVAPLATAVADHADAATAASLIEASMRSPNEVVRVSAAVAALDTTGEREDILAILEAGVASRDPLARDIARTGLGRIRPDHPRFETLKGRPVELTGLRRPSHTAVVTHGTFAARSTWWRPGGTFFGYLGGLAPPLQLHGTSFQWTGIYSDVARRAAADLLATWLVDQNLAVPDLLAHSHGGTVANLATIRGAELDRLVLLSWPVHAAWLPDFNRVRRIVDVRVRFDLVIMADRGGQSFDPPPAGVGKVESYVRGWFEHADTHDPGYWDKHGLAAVL